MFNAVPSSAASPPAVQAAVAVFSKPQHQAVPQVAAEIAARLRARGFEVRLDDSTAKALGEPAGISLQPPPDLAICLGGDGTLLYAARQLRPHPVPLLAVNLGTLGFLAEISTAELYPRLDDVLAGRYMLDRRTVLAAEVWRGDRLLGHFDALNDIVVSKGTLARIIEFELSVNQERVASYRADGLIVATPTGSTAYSLSAGGPIVHPALAAWAITPICPHTLTNRPLLVPDSAQVEILMLAVAGQTYLTLDGQEGEQLELGDRIVCRKSPDYVNLIHLPQSSFFDLLRRKLKWG